MRRHYLSLLSCTVAALLAFGSQPVAAEEQKSPRFEANVQPLLREKCFACHDAKTKQAGLSMETRDDLLKGGKSGAVVIPGKAVDSLLLTLVNSGKMPMGGQKLADSEIEIIRKWIEGGALRDAEDSAAAATSMAKMVTEREVHAILSAKCWVCHGRTEQKAGLDLRTRSAMLKGGKSGPVVVPGKPAESLLVKRVAAQEMPPPKLQEQYSVRGLTDSELAKVTQWIAAGARADDEKAQEFTAATDPMVKDKDRAFWAFTPPQRPAVPDVHAKARVRNPIDALVIEKLEAKGAALASDADRRTLMRRAYLDLIGLPPSPEEAQAYLADPDPKAYEHLVDKLLASPRYGERWARFWLDAVGYSDSEGGSSADEPRPHAWRFRDFVIRSLNENKRFDRFLTEQLAGDELFDYKAAKQYTPEQVDLLAATGFWRTAPDSTYSTEQNFIPERMDVIAGQVEILGSAVIGLSVGCARCHDHKYDPIPQRDYYRLTAVLTPAYDPFTWRAPSMNCGGVGAHCDDNNTRYLPLLVPSERDRVQSHNAPIQAKIADLNKQLELKAEPLKQKMEAEKLLTVPAEIREDVRKAWQTPKAERTEVQKFLLQKYEDSLTIKLTDIAKADEGFRKEKEDVDKQIAEQKETLLPDPKIRALFDLGAEPPPQRILMRGDPTTPGVLVEPGALSVLSAKIAPYTVAQLPYESKTTGRRLALARWLVEPNHPLTARVMVNRMWQHHFGTGIVSTPGNFGKMGAAPVNQPLLDWLATEFVRQGWDIKAMHRLIMTSSVYRQSSQSDAAAQEKDPDGSLLSRYPLRRLDSDAIRDSILKVAGRLDLTPFGPPDPIKQMPDGEVVGVGQKNSGQRRSIFMAGRRTEAITLLDTFDTPFMNPNCVRRAQSTVSSQALELMNSDLLRQASRYMAGRVMDAAPDNARAQLERMYWLGLARAPSGDELSAAESALPAIEREWVKQLKIENPEEPVRARAHWLAVATLCHTLLNSAEFLYVD